VLGNKIEYVSPRILSIIYFKLIKTVNENLRKSNICIKLSIMFEKCNIKANYLENDFRKEERR